MFWEHLSPWLPGYLHAVSGLRTSVLSAAVPAGMAMLCPAGQNRRSRRLLETTNTELNAIAAPAISGLRNPRAASGMTAVL